MADDMVYPMRAKGKIIAREEPDGSGALAKQGQPQKQNTDQRQRGKIISGDRPLPPNWICYPDAFKGLVDEHGNWLGKGTVPKCRVCQGLLHPKENHVCPGYHPKYPMLPSSKLSFEERKALRQAAWDDWDDDQYDRTTDGDIPINPDEEHSGTVQHCEYMTEEDWIAAKRRRMGLAPGYDLPDFEPEED